MAGRQFLGVWTETTHPHLFGPWAWGQAVSYRAHGPTLRPIIRMSLPAPHLSACGWLGIADTSFVSDLRNCCHLWREHTNGHGGLGIGRNFRKAR